MGTAASADGTGDPCIPQQESDPSFLGFDEKEVNLETRSPSCKTGVCLVNHFRGRTSCPYGQDPNGEAPAGSKPCMTTGPGSAVTGGEPPRDLKHKALVPPQCVDRPAAATVYCSCRCANAQGRTDDGARYCGCSAGFECTSLVTSTGTDPDHVAGSYCVKSGTAFDRSTACNAGDCDPVAATCR